MKRIEIDRETVRVLIEDQKLQQHEVSAILGVCRTWVQRRCYKWGLKTQRTGPRSGPGHPDWTGGTTICKGYRYIWKPDHPHATKRGYVSEHRLVMEAKLGRILSTTEVVHHKDGNRLNNHPDNLEVFQTNADHLRHELTGRVPKWTEDGKRRIREGVAKRRRKPTSDADQSTRATDHQPTSPDSTATRSEETAVQQA